MQVITTHVNADFDALAAVVAATRLYPGSVALLPGEIKENVRAFLNRYGNRWPVKYGEVEWPPGVDIAVIVDTSSPLRLGPLAGGLSLCRRVHLYDHRPSSPGGINGERKCVEQVGAVTTLLVEKLREQNISLTDEEATLMGMGIYEDTGFLTFSSTTPRDIAALSFLWKCGLNIKIIQEFLGNHLPERQLSIFKNFLSTAEYCEISGYRIVITTATFPEHVFGIPELTERVRRVKKADLAFTLADINGSSYIAGRGEAASQSANELSNSFMEKGMSFTSVSELKQEFCAFLEGQLTHSETAVAGNCREALNSLDDLKDMINQRLSRHLQALLWLIGQQAEREGFTIYLIGSFIRDLILDRPSKAVPLVVGTDSGAFARKLNALLKGELLILKHIGAAIIKYRDISIHLSTAQREFNPFTRADNPEIDGLRRILYRQDFTVDTLACVLNPPHFGCVYDFFQGRKDMAEGKIRVLYNLSFTEDPLRIMKAVRLEQRLGFRIEENTLSILKKGVDNQILGKISRERMSREISRIFFEPDPLKVLRRMKELNITPFIFPGIRLDLMWDRLAAVGTAVRRAAESAASRPLDRRLLYLCALFYDLPVEDIRYHCWRLQLHPREKREIIDTITRCRGVAVQTEKSGEAVKIRRSLSPEGLVLLQATTRLPGAESYIAGGDRSETA